ncbi:MAG: zinc ABC transporter substrate-binding protein [Dehalococcoidaceae bacterium]|nr:zinc ABC transporter substrate-binding protein [Dehalococcoidaceae bacterium]
MITSRKFRFVVFALVLLTCMFPFASCQKQNFSDDAIGAVVTILPQVEFVEAVGGEKVAVSVMIPPGASPHTYEPTPSQMTALAEADIYFSVGSGVEFEISWLDKLLGINRQIILIDCSEGIELIEAEAHDHEEEDHEADSHDPHIWLSPVNAQVMVANICDGLVQLDPDNREYYQQNRDSYIEKLQAMHQDFSDGFSTVENRVFMMQHPSMSYFARDYALIQLSVEQEGKEPTPAGMASLIEQAKEAGVRVIFVSPQFNQDNADTIAREIDGAVEYIDGLARDYADNMRGIFEIMMEAMN